MNIPVRGVPYAPGVVRGILFRGAGNLAPGRLCILSPAEIAAIVSEPRADEESLAQQFMGVGIIAVGGAPLSHAMIRLLSLDVPTVIASNEALARLREGQELILNGGTGLISTPEQTASTAIQVEPRIRGPEIPVVTADGLPVELRASVSGLRGAAKALTRGAAALGLVRSEYLLPHDNRSPDADYFESILAELCRVAHPLPVTVRLLDLASGKAPSWQTGLAGSKGPLVRRGSGLYGIPSVYKMVQAQVEAIGRLATRFDLSILLPHVSGLEEYHRWQWEFEKLLPVPVAVGAMIETPAAAMAISDLADSAGLVAIGCNDLMQHFFGVDRDSPESGHLLDPCAPTLFRFLHQVEKEAGDAVSEVQLCGLLPQSPGILPVLMGLGFRIFSVEPRIIPCLAKTIRELDVETAEAKAVAVCAASDSETVRVSLGLPAGSNWAIGSHTTGS